MSAIKWSIIVLIVIATSCLLAFGPRADESLPKNRVVIDYWEKWTGNEEAQMRVIVNDFNNTVGAQKGIFVRYVSSSTINQKTLVATAAGVPPDIAGLFDVNLVQFAAMGALEPLEDLARQHGITASYYKPVYWKGCNYNGHLWGLVSTPTVVALFYNKRILHENAAALRAAGLDPDRAPRSIDELDRYARVLTIQGSNGRVIRAGFLPMEPNWYVNYICYWFGGNFWDARSKRFTLTSPPVVKAYDWIQSYATWLGKDAMSDFRSGVGNFDSPQNAFLAGQVVMEMQGTFLANFIYNRKRSMSTVLWPRDVEMKKPAGERLRNYEWAVAPFPSAVPGLKDVAYCGFDVLAIPRGSKHKKEAFEFIAYVNRQDVMEKLNKMHCKNSPLAKVSEDFLNNHPNPYIRVFERLANSPNAQTAPQIPIMPEVVDELNALSQRISLLQVRPAKALAELQVRLQAQYDEFARQQRARGSTAY
ncbi:MAG TPA: extracellular solute-binding protein [Tepidisphaeraceae bacterium]|jgi:ABC-type glycerol-3-phosphate transport system substrate-binding protein|nr:extracellular solute-binding protein [Tepidisphaeraceae bacterium]